MNSRTYILPLYKMIYNQNGSPFLKIVYTKVKINGKVELVPMELYADGLLKHGNYRNPV